MAEDKDGFQLPLVTSQVTDRNLQEIPIEELPLNEKLTLEDGEPSAEFVSDILMRGQLVEVELVVTPGGYFVISGNRRIAAIRKCHEMLPDDPRFNKVRAFVSDEDLSVARVKAVVDNHMRSDNTLTDIEGINLVYGEFPNISDKGAAKTLGMTVQTLRKLKKIVQLNNTVLDAYKAGKISRAVAAEIASAPKSIQAKATVAIAKGEKLSVAKIVDMERETRTAMIDKKADQLFPGLEIEVLASEPEKVFLGVALMDNLNRIITEVITDLDGADQYFEQVYSQLPSGVTAMKVFVYGEGNGEETE